LTARNLQGKRWSGFALENVVAVSYAGTALSSEVVSEFTVRDLASGIIETHPAGGTEQ
jgi:hypothetical protein